MASRAAKSLHLTDPPGFTRPPCPHEFKSRTLRRNRCVLVILLAFWLLPCCVGQPEHLSTRTVTTKYGALRGFLIKWTANLPITSSSTPSSGTRSSSASFSASSRTSSSSASASSSASKLPPTGSASSRYVEVFLGVPYATGNYLFYICTFFTNINYSQLFVFLLRSVCARLVFHFFSLWRFVVEYNTFSHVTLIYRFGTLLSLSLSLLFLLV
jgi:hypothetical protein